MASLVTGGYAAGFGTERSVPKHGNDSGRGRGRDAALVGSLRSTEWAAYITASGFGAKGGTQALAPPFPCENRVYTTPTETKLMSG